jgi:hypothetical protein
MDSPSAHISPTPVTVVAISAAILTVTALVLYAMGQPLICECGYVKFWHGVTYSSENSQHIADWYTPSHVIHGLVFYAILWVIAGRQPVGTRLLIALIVEVSWEIFENTPLIINRYREVTISLDYFGDSVVNSLSDILAMVVGFVLAARIPVWASITVIVALEAVVGFFIRDNLTLNVIMLIYPVDAIRIWQAGG